MGASEKEYPASSFQKVHIEMENLRRYGIKCANKLSYKLGKIDETYYNKINFLIDKFSLTNKKLKFKKEKIVELMTHDKKVQNEKINLLLPVAPLEVELFDNIDLPLLEASLP